MSDTPTFTVPFYGTAKDAVRAWFKEELSNLWTDISVKVMAITMSAPIVITAKNPITDDVYKSWVVNLLIPYHLMDPKDVYEEYGGSRTKSYTVDFGLYIPFINTLTQVITIEPKDTTLLGWVHYTDDLDTTSSAESILGHLTSVATLCFGGTGQTVGRSLEYIADTLDTGSGSYLDYGFGQRYDSTDKDFPFKPTIETDTINTYHAEI